MNKNYLNLNNLKMNRKNSSTNCKKKLKNIRIWKKNWMNRQSPSLNNINKISKNLIMIIKI